MNMKEKLQQMETSQEFFNMTDEHSRTISHKNRMKNQVKLDDSDIKIWKSKQE